MKNKIKIPFDFYASLKIEGWRENYQPLVCERKIDEFFNQQDVAFSQYISTLPDGEEKDVFLLAMLDLKREINYYIVAIFAISKARSTGVEIDSTVSEINYLLTGDVSFLANETHKILSENKSNFSFIRRIVRTISWTSPLKIFKTLLFPEIIALGYNSTSIQYVKETKKTVYFYQAAALLKKIKSKTFSKTSPDYLNRLSQDFYCLLTNKLTIEKEDEDRLKFLLFRKISRHIIHCYSDLQSCYRYPRLPKKIWIGTGESYNNRLLAISVRRNGGKVTGFAHATGATLTASYHRLYQGEFAVVNNFIEISDFAKDIYFADIIRAFPSLESRLKIFTLSENIRYVHNQKNSSRSSKTRPVVMYLSTMLNPLTRGECFSENMQYIDWQLRLTDMLDKMNIDLICQPHPEGVFSDKRLTHPLLKKYQNKQLKFEDHFCKADVFLIDFLHSTTTGYLLTSNKPIVRLAVIDSSNFNGVNENIELLLNKRCRKVDVSFSDNCKPNVDFNALENALTGNWNKDVDSSNFQRIFNG